MRGAPRTMKLLRPVTPGEAVRLYSRHPHALPLAGGTDVMVMWNAGLLNGRTVLDLSDLRGWTRIRGSSESLLVGALATHAAVRKHEEVAARFPLLARACSEVGSVQVQNRGTIGGNIANASPAGDTFPPLAVYEATVHTVSPLCGRKLPFLDVFAGVKKTALKPAELIETVELPVLKRRPSRQLFRKVGTRAAQAISKTVAAGLLWLRRDGRVEELRFALGSMAPTVRRLRAAEECVRGKKLTPPVVREACALLAEDVSPIDDIRSTRGYRLRVSQNILRSFLDA